jgi:hypothetical protein
MMNIADRKTKWMLIMGDLQRIHAQLTGVSFIRVMPTNQAGYTQVKLHPAKDFVGSNYSEEFLIPLPVGAPSSVVIRNEDYTVTPHEDYVCQIDAERRICGGINIIVKIVLNEKTACISDMSLLIDDRGQSSLTVDVSNRKPVP